MTREEIEERVDKVVKEFIEDNVYNIDNDNLNKNRGYFKIVAKRLKKFVCDKIDKGTNKGLKEMCYYLEKVMELCDYYQVKVNDVIIGESTGMTQYILNRARSIEPSTIERLNAEYGQDIEKWFMEVDLKKEINYKNELDVYPLYCILVKAKENEQDFMVERGKLGDITQLNAPIEVGGFGYAKPSLVVDNRKVMIAGKDETISLFLGERGKSERDRIQESIE